MKRVGSFVEGFRQGLKPERKRKKKKSPSKAEKRKLKEYVDSL